MKKILARVSSDVRLVATKSAHRTPKTRKALLNSLNTNHLHRKVVFLLFVSPLQLYVV